MKIIAVAAGKGGTGQSCVAAYTGAALAQTGRKTLLAELGAGGRSLDIVTGLSETALFHIRDAVSGACDVEEAVAETCCHKNLLLLPAPPASAGHPVTGGEFRYLLDGLPKDLDYLILDGADFRVFPAGLPDCILMVCTPDTLSVRAAALLALDLQNGGARDIRLVINRVPAEILPIKGIEDFDDVIDAVGARLIAVIPESPKLAYASNNTKPLDRESLAPQVFKRLAERLMGKNSPLLVR